MSTFVVKILFKQEEKQMDKVYIPILAEDYDFIISRGENIEHYSGECKIENFELAFEESFFNTIKIANGLVIDLSKNDAIAFEKICNAASFISGQTKDDCDQILGVKQNNFLPADMISYNITVVMKNIQE